MSIERILREEFRAIGLTSVREATTPDPPHDLKAERAIIASIWEDVPGAESLSPSDFFAPLHSHMFEFVTDIHGLGHAPTVDLALGWLEDLGFRAPGLREHVQELAHGVPAVVPLGPLVQRVKTLARRRRALAEAQRLLVLIGDTTSTDEELERAVARALAPLRGDAS